MKIREMFETPVEEKIEPVIKVAETADERKLAAEIGSYVVTPLIEKYADDFLEHYTDTFLKNTTEIGVWISGYFGSGKSHLAKVLGLLAQNRRLEGAAACDRFAARVPAAAPRHGSIARSLKRMGQVAADVLAFNLNTLADSRTRPLPQLLLSQFYVSRGYGGNLLYARVIEAELDRQGKLDALHAAVEKRAGKAWADIQRNLAFYRTHLYAAAAEVAPGVFPSPGDVDRAMKEAERGELFNVSFLVDTILDDLKRREKAAKRPMRLLLVLDESGQWIENDQGRLGQLQALIEEAALKGQGRIWLFVTTHGDMGSIYKEARALEGDMKKIEGRFRFKFALTTENIELVLEDRLFRKTLAGKMELEALYASRAGVLRGLGELANTSQTLPPCTGDKFAVYYPFFPYQVHLIPEIVKTLRSKGGRGEQMSGSTRTLLAITQDILRAGRRAYLDEGPGALVSFDELYGNLAGEGEVSPDVRTELARVKDVVPGATPLTPKVAEVLYLIRELPFIPRTIDNIARLLVTDVSQDLPEVIAKVKPEIDRLVKAKLVAPVGDEYEFLTGERRTFEEELAGVEANLRNQDRDRGLAERFVHGDGQAHWRKWIGSDVVSHAGHEFPFRIRVDGTAVPAKHGDVTLKVTSPLLSHGTVTVEELETTSLRADERYNVFVLSGRVSGFDHDLSRYLAMREVIGRWKGDPHRSEEARQLAVDREANDLPKLETAVLRGLTEGIRGAKVVFRGAAQALAVKPGEKPAEALLKHLAGYWPAIYPKFDKVPVRIVNDQRAIAGVLAGEADPGKDVLALKLYDKAGKIDVHAPVLEAVRHHLATEQAAGRRVLGKGLLEAFSAPPYGWDPNAVRTGVAALVRAGSVKVFVNKKPYTNPADPELVDALRGSRQFDRVELILEETALPPEVLTETRAFLMKLAKRKGLDETPAALAEFAAGLAKEGLGRAVAVKHWAEGSSFPLPDAFTDGEDAWRKVEGLASPAQCVREVHASREALEAGSQAIEAVSAFREKEGAHYVAMDKLARDLEAIEHRLGVGCAARKLVDAFRTARQSRAFADKETWAALRSLKAAADLEVPALVEGWRDEARRLIQVALERLADDLERAGLEEAALAAELAKPLEEFRDDLGSVETPASAAALPDRAAALIHDLGRAIGEAAARKRAGSRPAGGGGGVLPEPKPTHVLRPSDVTSLTRVGCEAEWTALRDRLDAKVRALLAEGYEVELV